MEILPVIAGFFAGAVGAMGLGGGSVLIIFITLFTATKRVTAQGINLLFFIPTAVTAVTVYLFKKQIPIKKVLTFSVGGVLGALIGSFFANKLNPEVLKTFFAAALIIYGFFELFGGIKALKNSPRNSGSKKIKS